MTFSLYVMHVNMKQSGYATSVVADQMVVDCVDKGVQSEALAKDCQLKTF